MEKNDIKVSLSPKEAVDKIQAFLKHRYVVDCLDNYMLQTEQGTEIVMRLFEKYYMRVGNRATLTVLANNIDGVTNVHLVAGGSSNGVLFRFDWGACDDFVELAQSALQEYRLE